MIALADAANVKEDNAMPNVKYGVPEKPWNAAWGNHRAVVEVSVQECVIPRAAIASR